MEANPDIPFLLCASDFGQTFYYIIELYMTIFLRVVHDCITQYWVLYVNSLQNFVQVEARYSAEMAVVTIQILQK